MIRERVIYKTYQCQRNKHHVCILGLYYHVVYVKVQSNSHSELGKQGTTIERKKCNMKYNFFRERRRTENK